MEALNTNFTFRCFFALVDEALSHHKLGTEGGNCFEIVEKGGYEEHKEECILGVERTSSHQKELRKWGY